MGASRTSIFTVVLLVWVSRAWFGLAARVNTDTGVLSHRADTEAKANGESEMTARATDQIEEMCGPIREQTRAFCKLSHYQMEPAFQRMKLENNKFKAVALLKESDESLKMRNGTDKRCYTQYAEGATAVSAESSAMGCCEQKRSTIALGTKACLLVGPTTQDSVSKKCSFRFAVKPWFEDVCACPEDRPHVLVHGKEVVWHAPGADRLTFQPDEVKTCVDDCFARSFEQKESDKAKPKSHTAWPVVFLAVYKLGGPIVHSNLVFCPDTSIIEGAHSCLLPGADPSKCSSSRHTSPFKQGPEVPVLLQQHGCRELIFDGNGGGGIWSPVPWETGCWAQGAGAQEFWWDNGNRKSLGYPWMYWLTSSNTVLPFASPSGSLGWPLGAGASSVEQELSQCFSSKLHFRLDFNPGTYSLLHHNCNKFSSEAMRYLDLPLFSNAQDKGRHSAISFSATREESWWRRHLYKATSSLFGHDRSLVSNKCQRTFSEKEVNCRRVSGGGRKGDCPQAGTSNFMRCYDPSKRASSGTEGIASEVAYQGSANGVCGIPIGERCNSYQMTGRCQPFAKCSREVNGTKTVCMSTVAPTPL